MTQALTDSELAHLLDFVGYGSLNSDVWFLGMEEAGGGEANIRTRLKFRTVEDNADAHKLLGITKLHWGKRVIQRTWRGMCYIMLRLENKEPSRENIRIYQAEQLGRKQGNTLLTELMPIPKPKISRWGYENLMPQFVSREDYYQKVKPQRVAYLRQLLQEHRPPVVIGYGKTFWASYKDLFPHHDFEKEGIFEVANNQGTLVILTGHFTSRTMNGKFDDIVAIIRNLTPVKR
ncbi:MAG: hypothetical protein DHS20C20_28340 [Ardenticatenaceae bacterium]|nr:MAG: hypothetical protein DHS20C20_28340 [Ardenticatenaceae bacterium]